MVQLKLTFEAINLFHLNHSLSKLHYELSILTYLCMNFYCLLIKIRSEFLWTMNELFKWI